MNKIYLKRIAALALAFTLALGVVAHNAKATTFSDVPSNHWAYVYIQEMADKKIMTGTGSGKFSPDMIITLSEFSAMIARAFWPGALAETKFGASDKWWADIALTIWNKGGYEGVDIVDAYKEGGPYYASAKEEFPTTRYNIGQMCYNLMVKKGVAFGSEAELAALEQQFIDLDSLTAEQRTCMMSVVAAGIMKGKTNNTFAPQDTITRAEAATIMSRLLAKGIQPDKGVLPTANPVQSQTPVPTPAPTTVPTPAPTPAPSTEGSRYDMSKYNVPADLNKDGILTEAEVQAVLDQLKIEYPEDSPWGTDKWYTSSVMGQGNACAAWAFMVSDRIFGNLPRRVVANAWDMKIGDVIGCTHKTKNPHWSIFTNHYDNDYYDAASGNSGGEVSWEGYGKYENLNMGITDGVVALYTRWP